MAKHLQTVLKGDVVVAVVTASDHGAVAAAARKLGIPMVGLRSVRTMEYVASLQDKKEDDLEGGWEVDETDPDASKKDAALFARRNRR